MKGVVEGCLLECVGDAEGFRATFRFPAELDVFKGHFPGHPLVPGVFLIEAVRVAAERVHGKPLRITRVQDAKFTSIVEPEQTLEIEGKLDDRRCRAEWDGGSRVVIEFGDADC